MTRAKCFQLDPKGSEDPNESQPTTVVNAFLWVSLGTNQLIPQKAMQNHSVVMVMGSVIFSALITPPRRGCIHPASWSF